LNYGKRGERHMPGDSIGAHRWAALADSASAALR
jgi:hypothetical protein